MDCENVQIVINQSNELYGTLLYHQGRFTLVTLPDLDLAQKSKTALKAMFREGLSDTIELAAKGAMKAIASAIAKKCGYSDIYGIPARSVRLYLPNNMIRESVGILKDFLMGNL